MALVEDLTVLNAASALATDILYVGRPADADPDRQMLVSELHALVGGLVTTNSNGTSVRFPNGIQVCWHSLSVDSAGSTWTFPQAFAAAPTVVGSAVQTTLGGRLVHVGTVTTTTAPVFRYNTTTDAGATGGGYFAAFGTWSA